MDKLTDAEALATIREELVIAIRDTEVEAIVLGGAEYFSGCDLTRWERECIADNLLPIVTRECNAAAHTALARQSAEQAARLVEVEAENARLRGTLHREARACEMSAGIMRNPARTGGWRGAEGTAKAFDRIGATLRAALGAA